VTSGETILLNRKKSRKRNYFAVSKGSRNFRSELHALQLGTTLPLVDLPPRTIGTKWSIVSSLGENILPQ
jgi:hypothetical protein